VATVLGVEAVAPDHGRTETVGVAMKTPDQLGLPWPTWRPGQRSAIRTVLHAKTPHVVIQAPTGSGKTAIAGALSVLDERRTVVLTGTKGLQDQYANVLGNLLYDFRGMQNYECLAARDEFKAIISPRRLPLRCDHGPCHSGAHCTLKDNGCLYFDAKRSFLASSRGLTNYSCWLAQRRYGQGLGAAQGLFCDEAHTLPEQLMAAYRIEVPNGLLDGVRAPRTVKGWRLWAEQQIAELASGSDDDTRAKREKVIEDLKALAKIDDTWAWDMERDQTVFEPTIPRLLLPLLHTFDKASTVVYLSATITPHTLKLLNISTSDVTFEALRSTFPRERRPVYVLLAPRVDFRMTDQAKGDWIQCIADFIDKRTDRNGIIETVSFDRAEAIWNVLHNGRNLMLHRRGVPAAVIVRQFVSAPRGTVLISPSVTTGFDFPYQLCEFIVIAKLPFPNTQSYLVKARVKATPGYRDHLTTQTLVQGCGRGMRAADDQCEVAIVDGHARWWLEQASDLLPEWFAESIVKTRRIVTPPPRLA